ncbi:hypothetical protein CBW54_10485 [Yersinia kristensenii]|nr:hypothetical protein CBW54_10485 [Yersinia kristensenii]
MNNIEELKKVALGANLHGWTGFEDALNADGYSEAVSKFIGHCSPSAILALIAQLETAQKESQQLHSLVEASAIDDAAWHELSDSKDEIIRNLTVGILNLKDRKEKAEAESSAATERLLNPVVLPELNSELDRALKRTAELEAQSFVLVAEVVSKFGDPESFGEREIKVLADLRNIPYNTKLYSATVPYQVSTEFTVSELELLTIWAEGSDADDAAQIRAKLRTATRGLGLLEGNADA